MKGIAAIIAAAGIVIASSASADDFVNGYYRQNGTYVNPYMRTAPDSNPFNNYSARGNVNPYTGAVGTHNPYGSNYGVPSYGAPATNYGVPTYAPYGGIR